MAIKKDSSSLHLPAAASRLPVQSAHDAFAESTNRGYACAVRTVRFSAVLAKALSICFLAAMFVIGTARWSFAQSAVEGTVGDLDGRPIENVSLVLADPLSSQVRYGEVSDRDGHFRFDVVATGDYILIASHVGFARSRYPLRVISGIPVKLSINLAAQSVSEGEVVVSDRRARRQVSPVTFTNLTRDQLESRPDMKDLPVVISTVPSVTYYSENGNGIGYSTLRMRGFDQRRIAVAINGIPQNDPEDFNVFWINFFDIQGTVEDIQVQRGAGTAFYGSTGIGGAINIVARPYRPNPYAEAEVGFGAFGTRRFTAEVNSGLISDRYVVFGRVSRLESDGYRDWSWTKFWRYFGGVTRYGERSTLTLQTFGGPQRDGLAFSGIPRQANTGTVEAPGSTFIDRRYNPSSATRDIEDFHQPHVELHHELQLTERSQLRQSLFWVKGEGYFDFGATFRSADYLMLPPGFVPDELRAAPLFISRPDADIKFRAYLDQWQVGWIPRVTMYTVAGETTLGGELRLHRSLRWGRIQESSVVPADLVGSESDRRVYQFRGEKIIGSIFGSHVLRSGDRLVLQADANATYRRYRVYGEEFFGTEFTKTYLFLNPRLGITLFPQRPLSLYASIAYAVREPRLKSLYDGEEAGAGFQPRFEQRPDGSYDFSRPLVTEERLFDIEVGSTWRASSWVGTVNGYWMDFFDEIVPSGGLDQFGVPRTGNADRTRHVGVEGEATFAASKAVEIRTSVSVGHAWFRKYREFVSQPDLSVIEVDRSGNSIAGFPAVAAHTGVVLKNRGWTFSLNAKYVGRQNIDNSSAKRSDGSTDRSLTVAPYVLVDLSGGYAFPDASALSGLSIAVDVNNLLDDRVLLFGNVGPVGPQFFPTATRHAFVRVKYVLR